MFNFFFNFFINFLLASSWYLLVYKAFLKTLLVLICSYIYIYIYIYWESRILFFNTTLTMIMKLYLIRKIMWRFFINIKAFPFLKKSMNLGIFISYTHLTYYQLRVLSWKDTLLVWSVYWLFACLDDNPCWVI